MKYLFILITWMGNTAPFTQDIPIRDKVECERMEANLERAWKKAPSEFGYVIVCRKNPMWKPKGQRK